MIEPEGPDDRANLIIATYAAALGEWMREHGPSVMRDQLHLDADSPMCEFWRAGYLHALEDLVTLIRDRPTRDVVNTPVESKLLH